LESKNLDKISSHSSNSSHGKSLPRFDNLNGLRFFGAFGVFIFHSFSLGNETWGDFYQTGWFKTLTSVVGKGHYGVNLFFVLSGFLITFLLLDEARRNIKINAFGFFMRRLLRIWPVYFIVLLFGFVIYPHLPYGIQTTNSPVYYSLFLSNYEEIWHGWNDAVSMLTITWSVSIEEQFYIAWVALMLIIPSFRRGKLFLIYFTALIIASLIFRYNHAGEERVLYFNTLSVVSDLALGGYLSYLCFHFKIQDRFSNIPKGINILIYILGFGMLLGARTIFDGSLVVLERIAIGLFFAYVIFDQAYGKNSFFKVDKIPGAFKLGEISYGLYMYHCIVIYYIQVLMSELEWNNSLLGFGVYLVISALLTIGIAMLSYRFIEKPLLGLKKYFR